MITIAKLTIGEAARRKVLWVLVILALLAVGLTAWGVATLIQGARDRGLADLEIKFAVSQILIFIAFMFGFVLVMTAAFFGSPAIATDLESGVAQAMLARPLRRSSYLLGRWLGLAVVIVGYAVLAGFLAIGAVGVVSGYLPPDPILPVAYLAGQALVLLTLTVLLSTRLPPIAGGAIAVVAYGLAWMAGVLGKIGLALGTSALVTIGDALHYILPTDALWQGVVFGLEPSFVIQVVGPTFAAQSPFFADAPPSLAIVIWSVIWVALILALAINQLRRREL
ncbi:MAG TPA: ABC transporter permease subunit [Candidatus Limnocylindrales bacterium]|jgi:ABC-type transport system involved in multi-copper enzyme maturation permease subunit